MFSQRYQPGKLQFSVVIELKNCKPSKMTNIECDIMRDLKDIFSFKNIKHCVYRKIIFDMKGPNIRVFRFCANVLK